MRKKKAYSQINHYINLKNIFGRSFICLYFIFVFFSLNSYAEDVDVDYDEVMVNLNVPQIGTVEIPIVIRGTTVFLPVIDVFNFLKIKNIPTVGFDSITGFVLTQNDPYSINRLNNVIRYNKSDYLMSPSDFMQTEFNFFLKSDLFGQIFGLECTFNFRNLTVTLNTKLDLPIIRELRQEELRKNLNRLKGVIDADTVLKRKYHFLKFGMADWAVRLLQQQNSKSYANMNLALGGTFAGGETRIGLQYNSLYPFKEKQQSYLWRYVNNDNKIIKQIALGKIPTQATSSIFAPIIGFQLTNTPTVFRRSYGNYYISNYTKPGWIVELYVNNVLLDFVTADANGFYSFSVPLSFGNSIIKLRFYGQWGEELSEEQNITIPFNFIPLHKLEYNISGGIVEDSVYSRFSRSVINYGLNKYMTIGAGYEYLSSVSSGSSMPFVNAYMRIHNRILYSGEYVYGVRAKNIISCSLPYNIKMDLNYILYDKNQKAILYTQREERKAVFTIPLKVLNTSLFSRLTLNQLKFENHKYSTADVLFSGVIKGISTNFTTYAFFSVPKHPYIFSDLSFSLRLPKNFTFTPQIQYRYAQNPIVFIKLGIEKRVFKNGYFNSYFMNNFNSNTKIFQLSFRYEFPFANVSAVATTSNNTILTQQAASGSFIYNQKNKFAKLNSHNSVGKGGVILIPFLDVNNNGVFDNTEPKVWGLQVHMNGGRILNDEKDTVIRIFDLEPYSNSIIELDPVKFENISWQIKNKVMSVLIEPNQLRIVEVPVSVLGEVSGMVYFNTKELSSGIGNIKINFIKNTNQLVDHILTDVDGYYNFIGLTPGSYIAEIDTAQLRKLNMISFPSAILFEVKNNREGDILYDLNFNLIRLSDADSIIYDNKNKYLSDNPDYYKILNNSLKKSEYQEKDDKWNEYVYKLKIIANAATVVESKYTELISMKNKILVKRYDEAVSIADTKEKEATLKKLKLQKDEIKKLNANAEILTDLLKQIEKHTNNKKVDLIFVSSSINNIIYLINQYSLYGNSDDELQKINNTLNNLDK